MAEEELELDVNQQTGSKKTVLIIVIAVLVLNLVGGAVWYFLSGDDEGSSTSKETEKVLEPLTYLTMVPEFVVNFGPGSKVRYLQVDIQVSTRDEAALATVATYRPVLRNDILVVLSSVDFDVLKNRDGKEALQKKLLNTINKVVASAGQATNDDSNEKNINATEDVIVKGPIENVYFTSFIMQ